MSYALLTPVDTPVCLFRLKDGDEPELIDSITSNEPILSVADVVLQEHDLTLVRSAVTLTVNGELDEPDPEDLDEDEAGDDESETYELLVSFLVDELEYGLYIPLDPFFVVARMDEGAAVLVEGDEFDQIQPGSDGARARRGTDTAREQRPEFRQRSNHNHTASLGRISKPCEPWLKRVRFL